MNDLKLRSPSIDLNSKNLKSELSVKANIAVSNIYFLLSLSQNGDFLKQLLERCIAMDLEHIFIDEDRLNSIAMVHRNITNYLIKNLV